jgi:hypothetical protein
MTSIITLPARRATLGLAAALVLLTTLSAAVAAEAPKQLPGAAAADCPACHGSATPLPARHSATAGKTMADCRTCHAQKTPDSLSAKLPLSHTHQLSGVTCAGCHSNPKKPEPVEATKCLQCHPADAVSVATEQVKPTNPHNSPHYGKTSDCNICHHEHERSENYCKQCHKFEFTVP